MMFTLEQIHDLHFRLGRAATLFEYMRALSALGVDSYDSYLTDGHSEYFGERGYTVVSAATHPPLPIAEKTNREDFLKHLQRHERGETTYLELSEGLAASGIEKWTVDT